MQTANAASGGIFASPGQADSNSVGLAAVQLQGQLRSPTPNQLLDPDGKLRRRNSTLGWDDEQEQNRKVNRLSLGDANRASSVKKRDFLSQRSTQQNSNAGAGQTSRPGTLDT